MSMRQGFSGPDSYRYGFHTADPYNPLERFEERDGEGRVSGYYSYINPTGRRVTVNYAADQNGFQIVRGDGSDDSASSDGADRGNSGINSFNNNNNNNSLNEEGESNI